MIPGGSHCFCLGTLALLLTLSQNGFCVVGTIFAFNGFTGLSDVYIVEGNSQVWSYNGPDNYSIALTGTEFMDVPGRFLYPTPVQMTDPLTTTANNFSTTFIFQILAAYDFGISNTGPGLAFIIVPDNTTIGATDDYMGLLTTNTTETTENYLSDSHTVGVELDTFQNQEFNDPNNNHICIDVASMDSTSTNTFIPSILLTTSNAGLYQQVWIDYFQANSEMFIYHAQYPSSKPAIPLGSMAGVDLSILNEYMYVGFSSSSELATNNLPTIMAWSFSNEGEAPPIKIGKDAGAPTSPSPPPPPTPSSRSPPASRSAPPPNTSPPSSSVPAPAKLPSSPSSPPVIVTPSPPPVIVYPPVTATSPPSLTADGNSSPPVAPDSPSPSSTPQSPTYFGPSPGAGTTPPTGLGSQKVLVGALVGAGAFLVISMGIFLFLCAGKCIRQRRGSGEEILSISQAGKFSEPLRPDAHPVVAPFSTPNVIAPTAPKVIVPNAPKLRIFVSHTGGKDGSLKFFPTNLSQDLEKNPCYEIFIDLDMRKGVEFPEEIFHELRNTDLGIVVVTEEFFRSKWCMIELLEFVKMHKKKEVRILPLFYKLTPNAVRDYLTEKHWEEDWRNMSTENHPVDVVEYKKAVETLCNINGTQYVYNRLGYEPKYKEEILAAVRRIYHEIIPREGLVQAQVAF